jgi:hypothetical protein
LDAFEGISFLMADGQRMVRVEVHRELLAEIRNSSHQPEGFITTFERNRDSIEQIASAKYDEGDYVRQQQCRRDRES